MRLFSLDNRLKVCASFVRQGAVLADIGTDHAYLPVWLVLNNVIKRAIACDINEGPLSAGKMDVEKHNLSDKITLRLSDGLKNVSSHECDDIVIAGMGGELIARIIENCSWAKSEDKRFILQPMTKPEVLIKYLYENGFDIIAQKACTSDKKHYTVMLVSYTGAKKSFDEADLYLGKLDTSDTDSKLYLSHTLSHLQKRAISCPELHDVIKRIKGAIGL